jgi:HEPN domain-containing protein
MRASKEIAVAPTWMASAEGLSRPATLLLGTKDCPAVVQCSYAQQVVGKLIATAVTTLQSGFPKTHDIPRLPQVVDVCLELSEGGQKRLTDCAANARYLGLGGAPSSEALRAFSLAGRVRKQICSLLPKEILRRRMH